MKLIIDIPDNEYKYTCERTLHDRSIWDDAIRKGNPLDSVIEDIRPKGEWITQADWSYICSKCGYIVFYSGDLSNYCPDCGADMRGDNNAKA